MSVAVRPLLPAAGAAAAVAGALGLRVAVAGGEGAASSLPAAAVFALLLGGVGVWARRGRVMIASRRNVLRGVVAGVLGGAALVVLVLVVRGGPAVQLWVRPGGLLALGWTLLVMLVAAAEEVVFRDVLFDAVARVHGVWWAAVAGALGFALMHVPLYGWRAVPLDLGVGLWLGGLRVLSGGVVAPAVAHALADCGAWLVV